MTEAFKHISVTLTNLLTDLRSNLTVPTSMVLLAVVVTAVQSCLNWARMDDFLVSTAIHKRLLKLRRLMIPVLQLSMAHSRVWLNMQSVMT